MFEIIAFAARDCSDLGKNSLENEAECKEAALELGFSYVRDGSWRSVPKGCFLSTGKAYWNTHETGLSSKKRFPICRKGD